MKFIGYTLIVLGIPLFFFGGIPGLLAMLVGFIFVKFSD